MKPTAENMTGLHEVIHHPRYGIMRRPMWQKKFVPLRKKMLTRADFDKWLILDYKDVPKSMLQIRGSMASTDITCSRCGNDAAFTESQDGLCRDCYVGR